MSTQPAQPSARVFNVDDFSWVIDEPVCDILGRPVLVAEDVFFFWRRDMGVHSARAAGSRVRVVRSHRTGVGDSESPVRLAEHDRLHSTSGNPDLIDDRLDQESGW